MCVPTKHSFLLLKPFCVIFVCVLFVEKVDALVEKLTFCAKSKFQRFFLFDVFVLSFCSSPNHLLSLSLFSTEKPKVDSGYLVFVEGFVGTHFWSAKIQLRTSLFKIKIHSK